MAVWLERGKTEEQSRNRAPNFFLKNNEQIQRNSGWTGSSMEIEADEIDELSEVIEYKGKHFYYVVVDV